MKKQILTLAAISSLTLLSKAQTIIDTVSVGANYANQTWYSLQNDNQGTTQSKDNWDIAFEITGFSASILANNQKTNFMVYRAPYNVANYTSIDTTGINAWPKLYNSDTTWAVGAFNKTANPVNQFDLGWGTYDMSTHIITGDSCYVIKLSNTSYKKLKFDNLVGGIYNATYADINGTNSQTITINKASYTGKNFAYYNMTTNTAVDREPVSTNWDLTFVKYTSFIPTAYGVTGVLSNKGVNIAQADNVASPITYANWNAHTTATAINTIGYDWKTFDLVNNAWVLPMDTVYFVKARTGDIWKLRFTGFGGITNGDCILAKEKLSTVSINELNAKNSASLSVYPNPSNQDNVTVIYDLQKQLNNVALSVRDLTGKEIVNEQLNTAQGFYSHTLNTASFSKGIYLINLYVNGKAITQKFIKQ